MRFEKKYLELFRKCFACAHRRAFVGSATLFSENILFLSLLNRVFALLASDSEITVNALGNVVNNDSRHMAWRYAPDAECPGGCPPGQYCFVGGNGQPECRNKTIV